MQTQTATAPAGHAAHTQDANGAALPGNFSRRIKITVIGAGSGLTPRILNDILRIPDHRTL